MDRREVLKYTALITGSAIAMPLASSILSGCAGDSSVIDDGDYVPKAFSQTGYRTLREVIDTILPATSSPSATAVGVDQIIDGMVSEVYSEEERKKYLDAYALFEEYIDAEADGIFAHAKPERKLEILTSLDNSEDPDLENIGDAYLEVKQQTVSYYLSTEKISKEFLNFLPVPGEYQPCIPLSEVNGKAWAI